MGLRGKRLSVRKVLRLFAACLVVPATIAIGAMVVWNLREVRQSQEAELLAVARAASATVDKRVTRLATIAGAVATSEAVLNEDWAATERRVKRLELGSSAWVAITDKAGRRLLNTGVSPAAPSPPPATRTPDVLAALSAPGAVISDLFSGRSTGRKVVAASWAVPDSPDETVVTVVIEPRDLLPTPAELGAPASSITTLVDRRFKVIARSRDHERWLGNSATPRMARALRARSEDVVENESLEGDPTTVAYTRSPLTGWTTMVVVPRAVVMTPVVRSGAIFALLAALLLALGALLSRTFGRVLISDLKLLESDAARLGDGQVVAERSSRIENIGRVQAALGAASAELRRKESRQQLMINELNHRVKNTLATVQSLAVQTFRQGQADAPTRFDQRLAALAGAHDLLTQTSWEPVDLRDVATRCSSTVGAGIYWSGPSVMLPPQAALAMCMCLHELSTNCMKYGSLSKPGGKVLLNWVTEHTGEIDLTWIEQDGPTVTPPQRSGFGSRLLERLVKTELDGALVRDFRPEGLHVRLSFRPPEAARWSNDFH
jgi:two-component sensor histidine kinase